MILEQLIFTIFAFGLFVYIFFKMMKNNDTNYIGILVMQAIGIALNFISVLIKKELGPFFLIIKYILGIIIPVAIIVIEKRGIPLIQVLNVAKAKIYLKLGTPGPSECRHNPNGDRARQFWPQRIGKTGGKSDVCLGKIPGHGRKKPGGIVNFL